MDLTGCQAAGCDSDVWDSGDKEALIYVINQVTAEKITRTDAILPRYVHPPDAPRN